MCQSLFFNKVAGLRLQKKETLARLFSCEFCEIFKNTFFTENTLTEKIFNVKHLGQRKRAYWHMLGSTVYWKMMMRRVGSV